MKRTNKADIIRIIRKEIDRHEDFALQLAWEGHTSHSLAESYKKIALEELLEAIQQNKN